MSKTTGADGIEETEGADCIDIGSVLGHVERDLHVGLGTQVVDLGGEDLGNNVDEAGRVGQITVVKTHLGVYFGSKKCGISEVHLFVRSCSIQFLAPAIVQLGACWQKAGSFRS